MNFDHNKAPIYNRKVKKIKYLDTDVVMFEFLDQKIIWDENLEKELEFQEFIKNKLISDSFYNLPKGENLDSLAFQTKQMSELNISNC